MELSDASSQLRSQILKALSCKTLKQVCDPQFSFLGQWEFDLVSWTVGESTWNQSFVNLWKWKKHFINIKEYYNCNYYHSFEKENEINEVSGIWTLDVPLTGWFQLRSITGSQNSVSSSVKLSSRIQSLGIWRLQIKSAKMLSTVWGRVQTQERGTLLLLLPARLLLHHSC